MAEIEEYLRGNVANSNGWSSSRKKSSRVLLKVIDHMGYAVSGHGVGRSAFAETEVTAAISNISSDDSLGLRLAVGSEGLQGIESLMRRLLGDMHHLLDQRSHRPQDCGVDEVDKQILSRVEQKRSIWLYA